MAARKVTVQGFDDGVDRWRFARAAPAADLAGFVDGYTCYSEQTARFTTRREVPHGRGVLIINLGDPVDLLDAYGTVLTVGAGQGFVAGLHMVPAFSRSGGAQSGVNIALSLPSLRRLLGADMEALAGKVVALDALLGAAAWTLGQRLGEAPDDEARFALLDAAVRARLAVAPAADAAVDWAAARLRRAPGTRVAALAKEIGWGRQHFSERFRREIGVSPRGFARVARFEQVVAALAARERPDWAGLAAAHGFADQPHLVREISALSGLTPTQLVARRLPGGGGVIEG